MKCCCLTCPEENKNKPLRWSLSGAIRPVLGAAADAGQDEVWGRHPHRGLCLVLLCMQCRGCTWNKANMLDDNDKARSFVKKIRETMFSVGGLM